MPKQVKNLQLQTNQQNAHISLVKFSN